MLPVTVPTAECTGLPYTLLYVPAEGQRPERVAVTCVRSARRVRASTARVTGELEVSLTLSVSTVVVWRLACVTRHQCVTTCMCATVCRAVLYSTQASLSHAPRKIVSVSVCAPFVTALSSLLTVQCPPRIQYPGSSVPRPRPPLPRPRSCYAPSARYGDPNRRLMPQHYLSTSATHRRCPTYTAPCTLRRIETPQAAHRPFCTMRSSCPLCMCSRLSGG